MRVSLMLAGVAGGQRSLFGAARSDLARYAAMGGVILMTAVMAAVSAAFAVGMALQLALPWCLLVGALWGLVVFNLDRLLVTQMVRQASTRRAVALTVPRMVVALLLGTVISTPLVLQIFQREIAAELTVMHDAKVDAYLTQLEGGARYGQIPVLQNRIAQERQAVARGTAVDVEHDPTVMAAQKESAAAQAAFTKAENDVICEKEGRCGSGRAGAGIAFNEKVQVLADARVTRDQARARLAAARTAAAGTLSTGTQASFRAARQQLDHDTAALADLQRRRDADQRAYQAQMVADTGLLARLEALDRLSSHRPSLELAHLSIFGLLLTVELLPVVMKLLQILGPVTLYEQVSAQRDGEALVAERYRATADEEVARINGDITISLARHRRQLAIDAGRQANVEVVQVQSTVLAQVLDAWRRRTLRQVGADLEHWEHEPPVSGPAANGVPRLPGPPPPPEASDQEPATWRAPRPEPAAPWASPQEAATQRASHQDPTPWGPAQEPITQRAPSWQAAPQPVPTYVPARYAPPPAVTQPYPSVPHPSPAGRPSVGPDEQTQIVDVTDHQTVELPDPPQP